MSTCIYPGSFDAFHNGHANIVLRARNAFAKVVVLVADNPKKNYTFNTSQRIAIIESYFANQNITVDVLPHNSLVGDYAKENGIDTIIKGIRNIQDTEYEKLLHEVSISQEHGVDTFVLFSKPEDQKISSSGVKELIKYNADVRDYVNLYTKQNLEIKLNEQYIVGGDWYNWLGKIISY
jgi:pantetheine-phosphate adenylyltransferase